MHFLNHAGDEEILLKQWHVPTSYKNCLIPKRDRQEKTAAINRLKINEKISVILSLSGLGDTK
jgi:hypothetical protein